jgi:hypothetical protein
VEVVLRKASCGGRLVEVGPEAVLRRVCCGVRPEGVVRRRSSCGGLVAEVVLRRSSWGGGAVEVVLRRWSGLQWAGDWGWCGVCGFPRLIPSARYPRPIQSATSRFPRLIPGAACSKLSMVVLRRTSCGGRLVEVVLRRSSCGGGLAQVALHRLAEVLGGRAAEVVLLGSSGGDHSISRSSGSSGSSSTHERRRLGSAVPRGWCCTPGQVSSLRARRN